MIEDLHQSGCTLWIEPSPLGQVGSMQVRRVSLS